MHFSTSELGTIQMKPKSALAKY